MFGAFRQLCRASRASVFFVLLATATFAAEETEEPGVAVIPPGREELLADMLGLGAALPVCSFAGAQAERAVVRSHYTCPAGEVVIELRHPSQAPKEAVVTDRFVIVVSSGTAPPELLRALEARIRAREDDFEWTWTSGSSPNSPPEFVTQITRASGMVLVALVPIAVLGGLFLYRMRRRTQESETIRSGTVKIAAVTIASLALCASVHTMLRVTGRAFVVLVKKGTGTAVLTDAGLVLLLAVAATIAAAVLVRVASTRGPRIWVGVLIVAYFSIGWRLSLLPEDLHYFGTLSTFPPNLQLSESVAGNPRVSYRINRLGFRKPEFEETKPDGVIRIVLIGDSFVFGTGVDYEGTLPHQLAAELRHRFPGPRFEVLNLGIPGDNLSSHVELYSAAVERLHPDVVVLCLTLVNDLSRWDEQEARQDARRPSWFSFVRFLTGDAVESLWALMFLERKTTQAGLDHLDRQLSRLEEIRHRSPQPPLLVLFGFSPWETPVAHRLQRMSDVILVPNRTTLPEEFIAGDGHPTAIGNSRSAAHIADTLAAAPSWQRLLSPSATP